MRLRGTPQDCKELLTDTDHDGWISTLDPEVASDDGVCALQDVLVGCRELERAPSSFGG